MKEMIGQPQFIKEVNTDLIRDIIAERGPISKPELAKITSLSSPTVNKVVDVLLETGKIKVSGSLGSGIGRKAQFYVVNEDSGYILALYFMNDCYVCSIVNAIGEITYKNTIPVDTSTKDAALKSTSEAIDDLMSHAKGEVKAIGIGVPGVVKANNTISNIPSIPDWEGINLKEIMEEKYQIRTFVENDVKLTTVGFYHNELKQQYSSMAYIFIGKGIGSGIIIDKKLYKGFSSFAGELGYMIVEKPAEEDAAFIKTKGLLEKKVSAMIQDVKSADSREDRQMNINKLLEVLAYGIANMICILNPEVIALSGEITDGSFIMDLEEKVGMLVDDESKPIFMSNDCETSGISGVVNMCVSNISSRFRLVKEKGA